jgi:transcriptional regulator with XRE-family HTH domain
VTQPIPLSALLKQLRSERGQSLRGVASEIGVDVAHLSRVERGEKAASQDLCEKLASYYNVEPDVVALANGRAPADVVDMLQTHPGLLSKLRAEYGNETRPS